MITKLLCKYPGVRLCISKNKKVSLTCFKRSSPLIVILINIQNTYPKSRQCIDIGNGESYQEFKIFRIAKSILFKYKIYTHYV